MLFATITRMLIEVSLDIFICGFINIKNPRFDTKGSYFSFILSISLIFLALIFPIGLTICIFVLRDQK